MTSLLSAVAEWPVEQLDNAFGGPARRRVILLLAAVLALSGADQATVGASATQLESALHLSHTDLGLIAAVSGVVAAVVAVPLGTFVDRVNRTRLLGAGIALWAVAMAGCAATQSFRQLVLVRCALGAVIAIAAPATASLIGDYFAPNERGRIWGSVLAGELVGTGFGFTVAGSMAAISWRLAFVVLGLPAAALSLLVWRLPEPARCGAGRIPDGSAKPVEAPRPAGQQPMTATQEAALDHAAPYDKLVIREDPRDWTLWRAVRYVLRIRTNVVLIVAGAASYFFFAGVRAFGVEYVKGQYGIGQAVASTLTLILGVFAVVGVVGSGWLSDRRAAEGHLKARIDIAAIMLGVATLAFIPALLTTSFGFGVASLGLAAFALAAVNPSVDAGRLEIMHPTLWGRAEAVRSLLRQPAEALAPLIFGFLADNLDGGGHAALQATFLIMLAPLALAGGVVLFARRTYARDVATAAASIEHTAENSRTTKPEG